MGIGLPVPEIKFPRRSDKTEKAEKKKPSDKEITIALKAVEGALRQLGEKDMLLETADKGVLRFRLLAKTQFHNKDGEPVRDSLLKPGDRLRVSVPSDDEETALRIALLRSGTPAERAAASKPVDMATVKSPEGLTSESAHIDEQDPRPKLQRKPEAKEVAPKQTGVYEGKTVSGDDSLLFDKGDSLIEAARDAADEYNDTLPNFIVSQLTTRYMSTTRPAQWEAVDVVSAEVAVVNGLEEYRNVAVNGRVSNRPVQKTGSWSTGEFVSMLQHVLGRTTHAVFSKQSEDRIRQRAAYVYEFSVKQTDSRWSIHGPAGTVYRPGFSGSLWIDKETHRVLRIEMRSLSLPADFLYDRAEITLDYDNVRIENAAFMLPVHSENLTCSRGGDACTRNTIDFRNYRKFTAQSRIEFERKLLSQLSR